MKARSKEEYIAMLENTIAYYSENPKERRAVNSEVSDCPSDCVYATESGKHCAVGRWINYDNFNWEYNEACGVGDLLDYHNEDEEELFVPEAQGFSIGFWEHLQNLHDKKQNWTDTGLSEEGLEVKRTIIKKLEAGHFGC